MISTLASTAALALALQGAQPVPNMEAKAPPPPVELPMEQPKLPDPLPAMTMEQETAFRCGIIFGIVAGSQQAGVEEFAQFPSMEPRGQEFFVRTTAKLMEDERFTRPVVTEYMRREVMDLMGKGNAHIAERVAPCLLLLEASGI